MRSTDYISKGTAVARLYKAREYLLMDKDCRKGLCFYLRSVDILDYLEEIGIWNLDTFSIEVLWAYEDFINRSCIVGFINRSCIVGMGNMKVVERKLNTLYSRKDSFDARSSSKEIWGIARDSIPEISQKNFYWWDPNDREVRVKAIDLLINKVMKYGEGKED